MRISLFLVLSMAALLLTPPVLHAHSFQIETLIDAEGGGANDVNVGPDNISLAYDSLGNLGMCYFDATNGDLKFSLNDGNGWVFETVHVDPAGDIVGLYCSMTFDDDDNPNIVYFNTTDSALLHAVKNGALWTIRTVEVPVGVDMFSVNRLSLAKDGLGDLGVAYYDSAARDLKYAKFSNANWVVSVVRNVGDVGRYASLDFDSNNNPAIVYQDYTDMSAASLMFIAYDGNAWGVPEVVDATNNAGSYIAFKYDANNKPHIAYRHFDQAQQFYSAYYINKVDADWSDRLPLAQEMGPATGFNCQLTIDILGNVYIVYMDQFLSALFPDVNYLKLTTLYFASRGSAMISQRTDSLAVSVAPMIDYVGTAIEVDSNFNLSVGWARESDLNYDLVMARLTAMSPALVMTTPDANSHSGRDTFTIAWEDFDSDSNAKIRFSRLDANWVSVALDENALEDAVNTALIDITQVPRGDYHIAADISDDDFVTSSSSWAPVVLTVENHLPTTPTLSAPANSASVDTATPTLQWAVSSDVDSDAITYPLQLASDAAFANIVVNEVVANTQWTPVNGLNNVTTYYWRVRAVDSEGGNSPWTPSQQFTTNVAVAQEPAADPAGGGNNAGGGGNAQGVGGSNPADNGGGGAGGAAGGGVGVGGGSAVASAPSAGGCALIRN